MLSLRRVYTHARTQLRHLRHRRGRFALHLSAKDCRVHRPPCAQLRPHRDHLCAREPPFAVPATKPAPKPAAALSATLATALATSTAPTHATTLAATATAEGTKPIPTVPAAPAAAPDSTTA
jgi:hypothetical protein